MNLWKNMQENFWEALKNYNYPAKSGLDYINEFTFLIAILLSAQARDVFINTQTKDFFEKASNAEDMHNLGVEEIYNHIRRIGLWRNKGLNIHKLSKTVLNFIEIRNKGNEKAWYESFFEKKYEEDDLKLYGEIISKEGLPSFRAGLLELAGIGRKSANVFLNVVYNAPVFPVDTHVQRLATRLNIAKGTPFEIEKLMEENVPEKYKTLICHWLIWHGREICLARNPKCSKCELRSYCNYVKK